MSKIWLYNKFKGSRKITGPIQTTSYNIMHNPESSGLPLGRGKRHFSPSYGVPAQHWKPSLKVFPEKRTEEPLPKITDVPYHTQHQLRKDMHVRSRSSALLLLNTKSRTEQQEVRDLEKWEDSVLHKKSTIDEYLRIKANYKPLNFKFYK